MGYIPPRYHQDPLDAYAIDLLGRLCIPFEWMGDVRIMSRPFNRLQMMGEMQNLDVGPQPSQPPGYIRLANKERKSTGNPKQI